MATKTGIGKDDQKIELSEAQSDPRLAEPSDFEILENGGLGGETLPFDGACGDSRAEYKKLTKADRDKGKGGPRIPLDKFGRRLAVILILLSSVVATRTHAQGTTVLPRTTVLPGTTIIVGASGGGAAPPFIQGCNAVNFSGTSQPCGSSGFSSNVASTSILVITGIATSNTTTLSISSSGAGCGSTTWTPVGTALIDNGSTINTWTGQPAANGACTVTIGSTVSTEIVASGTEYGPSTGGIDTVQPMTDAGGFIPSGNIPCPAITTAGSNERVICVQQDTGVNNGGYTAGSGFSIDYSPASTKGFLYESQAKASAGSVTPGASSTVASVFGCASIAIKP
jgi:hypothetical protein